MNCTSEFPVYSAMTDVSKNRSAGTFDAATTFL